MSDEAADAERELLRRENRALNEQIKLLVQTEQRLYRSQNELDAQLDRIRALSRFALGARDDETPADIANRALDVLAQGFALDWIGAITVDAGASRASVIRQHEDESAHDRTTLLAPDDAHWLASLDGPASVTGAVPGGAQALWRLLSALAPQLIETGDPPRAGFVAAVPIEGLAATGRGLLLACSVKRRQVFMHAGAMAEHHVPFLALLANHVNHATANALLTESLRERSAQLAASFATLEKTQQELLQSQKLEAVGRLAGGVAHDFNNLLTVILGYTESLANSLEPDAPAQVHVGRVLEAARRAAAITSQLLALGRRQIQRREDFDLSVMSERTLDLLRRLVGEHIQIDLALDHSLPHVRADRSQIEQVLLNLVVNARDAMPEGGAMRIATRRANPAEAARCDTSLDPARFAVIEVEDEGVGMDENVRARAFEPFFTTKGAGKGSGLGLAVVYGIVKQSEGHVLVDSEPGRGARFTVLLPLAEPPAPGTAPAEPGPAVAAAPLLTVFVVEDEEAIREVVTMALRRAGYAVLTAADGEDALARLELAEPPDLLLTDVLMPKLGGIRLAERLQRRHPKLRVAYMSGYSEDLVADTGEPGSAPFLAKPFTPTELVAFVRRQLDPDEPDGA